MCQWLSLWESWRGAPERARMLPRNKKHSDKMALTKANAYRCVAVLWERACPLGHAAFVKEISCFILCRTTSRQPRCTSAVRIQLMG